MLPLLFRVEIVPVPCSRPKVTKRGTVYYPKRYTMYKGVLSALLKACYVNTHNKESPIEGPVSIDYLFVLPRPKYMKKGYSTELCLHAKRPDLDNLLKGVNDALEWGGVLKNDSQITDSSSRKRYAEIDGIPRIEVTIKQT